MWVALAVFTTAIVATAGVVTRDRWIPGVQGFIASVGQDDAEDHTDHDHMSMSSDSDYAEEVFAEEDADHGLADDEHTDHDPLDEGTADHNEATTLELSEQGRKNIDLTLVAIELRDFERTISMPAMLVDRPGQTEIAISAPMTGIVERIHPIRGEAILPGEPLFDLRLTHEDLVVKQSEVLRALEELDVVCREVTRLEEVTRSGAVAGKQLLEREYEQQKIEAAIRAECQALLLHGLTEEQIDSIVQQRRLLQSLTITAPATTDCQACSEHEEYLQVSEILVIPGEHVSTGTRLCTLTDHCQLYVEGKAFEHDADILNDVANDGIPVTAIIDGNGSGMNEIPELQILYVENQVELDSRALKFYIRLPNELVRNEQSMDGRRFIGWRYRPGQRVDVLLPVERWENCIVLPPEAVVEEGAERFVYRQEGEHFDQQAVHVQHRSQQWVVIDNDGTLSPGDIVAGNGAYQIHLALKNKSGGGVDPHAGHQH